MTHRLFTPPVLQVSKLFVIDFYAVNLDAAMTKTSQCNAKCIH